MKLKVRGMNVAVIGLGLEGKDAINYFLENGANITVFDKNDENNLDFSEIDKKKIKLITGEDYLKEGLSNYQIIVRSPGVYRFLPEIVAADETGSVITSTTKIFFDLFPGKIIGVTGTKGKGTTSTLIYNILKQSGFEIFLAGNIGTPMLEVLKNSSSKSWAVLELSSFQLIDLDTSPHIAVVLNITADHLDWHKNKKEYIDSKKNIVLHQKKTNCCVVNYDYETSYKFSTLSPGKKYFFSKRIQVNGSYVKNNTIWINYEGKISSIGRVSELLLKGEHNWENVTAAVCASLLAGASIKDIKNEVYKFRGLEHRLELVKTIRAVSYYNDSFSTNPQTTAAAVDSFSEDITLILGGSDKGLSYNQLARHIVIKSNIKCIILIGLISDKIRASLLKAKYKDNLLIYKGSSMDEIVGLSQKNSIQNSVVLLSPATASFDMFENYKDRGIQFKKAVNNLK